jgi:hypothetical protein
VCNGCVQSASAKTLTVSSTTHVGVRCHADGVLAHCLQRAVGQADLRLLHRQTHLDQRLGDVGIGDRTEQAAVDTGLLRDAHGLARQLLAQRLGRRQLVGGGLLEVGALLLELRDRGLGGAAGATGRDQEVARVAVLDLDDVTQIAELG